MTKSRPGPAGTYPGTLNSRIIHLDSNHPSEARPGRKERSGNHYPLSTIHNPLSTIHYPLSIIHYLLPTTYYLLLTYLPLLPTYIPRTLSLLHSNYRDQRRKGPKQQGKGQATHCHRPPHLPCQSVCVSLLTDWVLCTITYRYRHRYRHGHRHRQTQTDTDRHRQTYR